MSSSGIWRRVGYVTTYVSEERITSIMRGERNNELGTTLAVTNKTLFLARWFSPLWWWWVYVPPKRRFLQEPHGVTSQETAFFSFSALPTLVFRAQITTCVRTKIMLCAEISKGISWYCVPGKVRASDSMCTSSTPHSSGSSLFLHPNYCLRTSAKMYKWEETRVTFFIKLTRDIRT
jgi:hypothetical protein